MSNTTKNACTQANDDYCEHHDWLLIAFALGGAGIGATLILISDVIVRIFQ